MTVLPVTVRIYCIFFVISLESINVTNTRWKYIHNIDHAFHTQGSTENKPLVLLSLNHKGCMAANISANSSLRAPMGQFDIATRMSKISVILFTEPGSAL